jgi:predicted methyltransferase
MSEARQIAVDVAATVRLAEGEAGVRDVALTVARLEPVAVRRLSRATNLPVPIVSAICNELRRRDVVARERPVRLTPRGRALFGPSGVPIASACSGCGQRGTVIPPTLAAVERSLSTLSAAAPGPRRELDQTHCDVPTKLRRVLAMHEAHALEARRILLLGDDDLTSVAIALVCDHAGFVVERLTVIDVDRALLSFLGRTLRRAPFPTETIAHDLRRPIPEHLRGAVDTVFADPPYTPEGAALFLSRAAEAVAGAPRGDVFLAFGGRRPDETARVQREMLEMGFVIARLIGNFNEYVGAGALGGVSHLYRLSATSAVRPLVRGEYDGRLYTGDFRPPLRRYRCRACRRAHRVGPGQLAATVEELRRDGCPVCGGRVFAPIARR